MRGIIASYLELLLKSMNFFALFRNLTISSPQQLYPVINTGVISFKYKMSPELFISRVQLHNVLLRLSDLFCERSNFFLKCRRLDALQRIFRRQRENLLLDFLHLFPAEQQTTAP